MERGIFEKMSDDELIEFATKRFSANDRKRNKKEIFLEEKKKKLERERRKKLYACIKEIYVQEVATKWAIGEKTTIFGITVTMEVIEKIIEKFKYWGSRG